VAQVEPSAAMLAWVRARRDAHRFADLVAFLGLGHAEPSAGTFSWVLACVMIEGTQAKGRKVSKGRYWHFFDNISADGAAEMRLWVALPPSHRGQAVTMGSIHPQPEEIVEDELSGNRVVFWRLKDVASGDRPYCTYGFEFERETVLTDVDPEKVGPYDRASDEVERFTLSEPWIEVTDEIEAEARRIVAGETNPYLQARRIFEWILDNMVYEYPDAASRGAAKSAVSLKGDCGEFSFVFCAMCRSLGIPARAITCMWLTEAGHVWAEILLPGYGWVPVDPSFAQGLAGKSAAFGDESRTRAFAESLGVLEVDPNWLFGNLYSERLIICVGNNLDVEHRELGIARTFRFLQPGGVHAVPPSFEAAGFAAPPVEAGFFVFGDAADDIDRARAVALRRMAPGYLAAGAYEMAEKGLRGVLEEKPDDGEALLYMGQCHLNQGRFDDAIEALRASLAGRGGSTKPVMDAWAHNLLGVCYQAKGEVDEARREFQLVIDSGIDFQGSQRFARDQLRDGG